MIDVELIDQYVTFLERTYKEFLTIADKHLMQFEACKYIGNANIPLTKTQSDIQSQNNKKITWNGSVQEFVHHFANLIIEKKIFLNSEHKSETDPIVKYLYKYFYIKKDIGDKGEISEGSLSTYFKKYRQELQEKNKKK